MYLLPNCVIVCAALNKTIHIKIVTCYFVVDCCVVCAREGISN